MENNSSTHRVVILEPGVEAAPKAIREEVRRRLEEIATSMEAIPPDSPFWVSIRVSRLCLVVRGWSIFYTVDRETVRATEVKK